MALLHEVNLIPLIESQLGVECYLDIIPDESALPAAYVGYTAQSPLIRRQVNGYKIGEGEIHQVGLVAGSMSELASLANQFELLDNTSSADFQRVFVRLLTRDNSDNQSGVYRVIFELISIV